jgi:hypothetical protein
MSKADSIKARLRNLAIKNGKPFDYVLTHYFIERVLYRLSVSPYTLGLIKSFLHPLYVLLRAENQSDEDWDCRSLTWRAKELSLATHDQ